MKNQNLLIGVVIIGGLLYMNQKPKENYYNVPGVGDVAESKLPDYGYVKYNGKWFKYTDLQAAALANNIDTGDVDISTQEGLNLFLTLLQAGLGLTTTIIQNTAAQKADLIEQILTKYTLTVSASYDDDFPFTESQLQGFTIAKLNQILGGNFSVSGITERPDKEHSIQCRDGNYTNRKGSGACAWHKGVRQRAGASSGRGWTNNL